MNRNRTLGRALALMLCLLTLLTLISCGVDRTIGDHDALAEQTLACLLTDDRDGAYALMISDISRADFDAYWERIRPVAEGATSYEIEQVGWHINLKNGVTSRTVAYQVYLDNGKTALLRIVTRDGAEGIAVLDLSDATAFLARTDAFVPVVRIVLWGFSALCFGLVVWMLIDCVRRKIRYKVLWILLILAGLALTLTVGQQNLNFNFFIGAMLQTSSITADPALLEVTVKLVLPIGAILYLCLRRRLTVAPAPEAAEEEVAEEEEAL